MTQFISQSNRGWSAVNLYLSHNYEKQQSIRSLLSTWQMEKPVCACVHVYACVCGGSEGSPGVGLVVGRGGVGGGGRQFAWQQHESVLEAERGELERRDGHRHRVNTVRESTLWVNNCKRVNTLRGSQRCNRVDAITESTTVRESMLWENQCYERINAVRESTMWENQRYKKAKAMTESWL